MPAQICKPTCSHTQFSVPSCHGGSDVLVSSESHPPSGTLLPLTLSLVLIHIHSFPFSPSPTPTPFPSCSLSLINLFRYVPSLSYTPLKPSPPSHLAAQRLESVSSITVILTLTPPSCLTSLSPISIYHSTDQLLRVAAAAALGPVGHECLLKTLLHTLSRLLLFLGHLPLVSFFGLSPPSDL